MPRLYRVWRKIFNVYRCFDFIDMDTTHRTSTQSLRLAACIVIKDSSWDEHKSPFGITVEFTHDHDRRLTVENAEQRFDFRRTKNLVVTHLLKTPGEREMIFRGLYSLLFAQHAGGVCVTQ